VTGTGISGEQLRDGDGGEALGCVAAVEKRKERVRSELRRGRGAGEIDERVGRGGQRTPPGRRRRHTLTTRRGEPDMVGCVRARGEEDNMARGPGRGGRAGSRQRAGERERLRARAQESWVALASGPKGMRQPVR
jgi:hypothetical protein